MTSALPHARARFAHPGLPAALAALALFAGLGFFPSTARANEWQGFVHAGGNYNFSPELVGRGWVSFDALGLDVVGNGDLRAFWNTDKIHVGIERLQFANDKLAFFAFVEGELVLAQILRDYFQRGLRIREFGFDASYVVFSPKLQWYAGRNHTLELILPVRHWWFRANGDTSPLYELPPNTWAFEPRIGYVYWNVDSPGSEFGANRIFPRVRGIALGISGGLDVRSRVRAWGLDDGRNDPDRIIYTVRQWFRAGWQFVPVARLQLDQWGSYGWGEDDITRNRVGGTSPYVVPIPGLPWTGLVSERLFSAQLGMHFKAKPSSPHEFGFAVAGGAFNDVTREGRLDVYGGTGGVSLFGDLRFGKEDRYQINIHASYGFPTPWLLTPPYFGGLIAFGARVF